MGCNHSSGSGPRLAEGDVAKSGQSRNSDARVSDPVISSTSTSNALAPAPIHGAEPSSRPSLESEAFFTPRSSLAEGPETVLGIDAQHAPAGTSQLEPVAAYAPSHPGGEEFVKQTVGPAPHHRSFTSHLAVVREGTESPSLSDSIRSPFQAQSSPRDVHLQSQTTTASEPYEPGRIIAANLEGAVLPPHLGGGADPLLTALPDSTLEMPPLEATQNPCAAVADPVNTTTHKGSPIVARQPTISSRPSWLTRRRSMTNQTDSDSRATTLSDGSEVQLTGNAATVGPSAVHQSHARRNRLRHVFHQHKSTMNVGTEEGAASHNPGPAASSLKGMHRHSFTVTDLSPRTAAPPPLRESRHRLSFSRPLRRMSSRLHGGRRGSKQAAAAAPPPDSWAAKKEAAVQQFLGIVSPETRGAGAPAPHGEWQCVVDKGGVRLWKADVPGSKFCMIKLQGEVQAPPKDVLALLTDTDRITDYDEQYDHYELLEKIEDDTLLGRGVYRAIWPTAPRDFVLMTTSRMLPDGRALMVNQSHPCDQCPPRQGFARGQVLICGFLVEPLEGGHASRVTMIGHMDPGGALPSSVINKLSSVAPVKVMKNLQKLFKK